MKDGDPCSHPGCLSHISHPCEGCGRVEGKMKPIPEMTRKEVNRELCERLGIDWHEWQEGQNGGICSCGISKGQHVNPDFYSDPEKIQLLREMKKRQISSCTDWYKFVQKVLEAPTVKSKWYRGFDYDYLTEEGNGLLAKAVLEWLRSQ